MQALSKVICVPALFARVAVLSWLLWDRLADMNAPPMKVCLKWVGLWALFVSVVVLFTVVFSFLGTISCAVIAGMAMAAARLWTGHIIASSLVFPGVVLALAQTSKIDLVPRERISVAAVCFGAYWVTFLVTFILLRLERRNADAPSRKASLSTDPPDPGAGVLETLTDPNPQAVPDGFSLRALQGRWRQEIAGSDQSPSTKTIEICGDRFVLCVTTGDGNARVCGAGVVKLEGVGAGTSCARTGSGADVGPAPASD